MEFSDSESDEPRRYKSDAAEKNIAILKVQIEIDSIKMQLFIKCFGCTTGRERQPALPVGGLQERSGDGTLRPENRVASQRAAHQNDGGQCQNFQGEDALSLRAHRPNDNETASANTPSARH